MNMYNCTNNIKNNNKKIFIKFKMIKIFVNKNVKNYNVIRMKFNKIIKLEKILSKKLRVKLIDFVVNIILIQIKLLFN